jgi:hypothetical protein
LALLGLLVAAPLGAVAAQQPAPPLSAPPPAAVADTADDPGPDPVGFLLEYKDSLRLTQDVVDELVRINLDLFRRTRPIQRRIDSIVPPVNPDIARPVRRSLTPEQRAALTPLMAQRMNERRRARDAAYELLSPEQQQRARDLLLRLTSRRRR